MSGPGLIRSAEDLARWKDEGLRSIFPPTAKITVGYSTCGLASGAKAVYEALTEELSQAPGSWIMAKTSCIGLCQKEPIVEVYRPGQPRAIFHLVNADKARRIAQDLIGGRINPKNVLCSLDNFPRSGQAPTLANVPAMDSLPFYRKQKKIVLARCGRIDPESLAEYVATGGYQSLLRVLSLLSPVEVIAEVDKSGLRGRGGAGFPTGRKWRFARQAGGRPKYIICNADEGDPGAYMDRSVLEGDPFAVLEGMTIGAFAIGDVRLGIIYARDEYPLAIDRLEHAIAEARRHGLLGQNILGRGLDFDLRLVRGGGAFVCGEETALIASVEGRLGEPSQRPPFPAEQGLWGKPTTINNVETWANVPYILSGAGEPLQNIGTATSKGTKVFSIVGKINNTGLIEVPMGIKLREIIFEIGEGIPNQRRFKAIQTGGPSGGCIPEQMLDLAVDYEGLNQAGAIMGSGGMIVMDEDICMVGVARYFLDFLKEESCGKCAPCREGIDLALAILERIVRGRGEERDLALLEDLGSMMRDFSLCALGKTAPNPLLSTLRYFRSEYEAHIRDRKCPAKSCRDLIVFSIDAGKCNGCGACVKVCPQQAIAGEKKAPHVLDRSLCIKCGMCFEVCKQDAVEKE